MTKCRCTEAYTCLNWTVADERREQVLSNLANVLIDTVERHLRDGRTPLYTAICQQLRNALPLITETEGKTHA